MASSCPDPLDRNDSPINAAVSIIAPMIAPAVAIKKWIETIPLFHQNVPSASTVTATVTVSIQRISRQ